MNFTDEEIRIKVAEAHGTMRWSYALPTKCIGASVPNYPEDLNACASFEATLTDEEKPCYVGWLNASHPTSDIFYPDQSERGFNNKLAREVFGLVSATARQRCLAYLKTKGLLP